MLKVLTNAGGEQGSEVFEVQPLMFKFNWCYEFQLLGYLIYNAILGGIGWDRASLVNTILNDSIS